VPGKLLGEIPHRSDKLLANLGYQLGQLTQALHYIHHPQAKRYLKWDLQQAQWLDNYLQFIANQQDQEIIRFFLSRFLSNVLPHWQQYRQSIIHGDINDYNIVVACGTCGDEVVLGFIDFGDVVETAAICELAIAIAYAIFNNPDPLAAATIIINSYHAVFPLLENEITVLFDLIAIRLCMSVVNSAIRKKAEPDNAYLTISEKSAWTLLKKWRDIHPLFAQQTFRDACQRDACSPTRKDAVRF
jgi:Ser/Thr protein kinase RdoA (MazF antagonist)